MNKIWKNIKSLIGWGWTLKKYFSFCFIHIKAMNLTYNKNCWKKSAR